MSGARSPGRSLAGRALLAVIGFYSRAISPALPPRCRFQPTRSLDDPRGICPEKQYGIESRLPAFATLADLPGETTAEGAQSRECRDLPPFPDDCEPGRLLKNAHELAAIEATGSAIE